MSEDYGMQKGLPPRRAREDYSGDEDLPPLGAPFPTSVTAAGVIWIVMGSLILLGGVINLLAAVAGGGAAPAGAQMCGVLLIALFGGAFLMVGVQSVRGTARDTLGNGIGSIIFAVIVGGAGALVLAGGAIVGGVVGATAMFIAVINLLEAAALLIAGVMALVGREGYKTWQRAERQRKGENPF
jgi:hypothetical protein